MAKSRLDQLLANRGITASRSQAESYIKLGLVKVDGRIVKKTGAIISEKSVVMLTSPEMYVSRGGLKLSSANKAFSVDFRNKTVLDVGSSTGGFTDYCLKNGASKIIAVDSGSNQLHPKLRDDPRIELYEQTDIRTIKKLNNIIDIVLVDVSFISVREILPHLSKILPKDARLIVMVKPQFETNKKSDVSKGVIKNNSLRRQILSEFEVWAKQAYKIEAKTDSAVAGEKGNVERFYLLKTLR